MKKVYGYLYGEYNFEIFEQGNLFYLKLNGVLKIKTDNQNIAKSYIDGWIDCKKTI
jgi:hypothetical protein